MMGRLKVDMAVLWVGASPKIVDLYGALFVALETELSCALDGADGLLAVEGGRYDLVIVDDDMGMPSCLHIIGALHRLSTTFDRPRIIALSGEYADVRALLEAGADGVRPKPISARALRDELAACRPMH
jgi:DNA-binding response OmpR family regulator